ncbi:MAG: hypothetical protein ACKVOK_07330 [Flavobacteriales bacterium]
MKKNRIVSAALIAIMAAGCHNKEKTVYKTPVTETVVQADTDTQVFMMDIATIKDYRWPGSTDPFEIVSTRVSGDSLLIQVQYGGGCKDHGFKMTTNLMWLKSKPPQLNIYLEHENNEDNCRALMNRTLAFDLKSIRNSSSDKIRLILNDDREKMIEYAY